MRKHAWSRPNSRRTRIQLFAGAVHARLDLIFSRSCTLSEIAQRALKLAPKSRVARSEAVQEGLLCVMASSLFDS